ncbi:hypothetical protein M0805_008152 [Coniferiporia weirii]|nr:hypothetical protein M0805_008152 [Coniferiporia weirii]
MPALRSRDDRDGLQALPCTAKPQAHLHDDADMDAMSMSMSMSFHGNPSIGILSPTPRALSFPQHPMLDLDGPTPRAFSFPASVHDALRAMPLTPPEPSPSTPSTSPSPFELERDDDGSSQASPAAPDVAARRSFSQQRIRTQTASPAAQISSFNAPDAAPGVPITLAHRRRGSSISSLALPPNPHMYAIQLNGPERRPKRGDEDYIKRPENAFILFRRDCCLRKNEAEAAAASEGDPVARRQRQADLSKTISQQWRSLSAEDRKQWDDLAKQRKKEHEEMYPSYVYQPSRAKEKKGGKSSASSSVAGGKTRHDGKKERREKRDKSSSRVRGTGGQRARGLSSSSTASTASSSASTVDSEEYTDFDSADSYMNGRLASYRELEAHELEMGEFEMGEVDFDMTESDASSASRQLSLPMSFMLPTLGNGLSIDTRNPLASFSLDSGPIGHHGHGHGHSHSLSAQMPTQTTQNLGPLSFVLPQGRRSTSAPGASTPPPAYPPTIKIPTLLSASSSVSSSPSPTDQSRSQGDGTCASEDVNGGFAGLSQQEQHAMQSFQFPAGPMNTMGFASLSGQVSDFSTAGGEMHHNSMFQVYEQQVPDTAKPMRARALSQIAIPSSPSAGGPLSAPAPSSTPSAQLHRLYLPGQQQQHFSPSGTNTRTHLQVPQRAVPLGLPESPRPGHDWDETLGLPSWAMPIVFGPVDDSSSSPMPANGDSACTQVQSQGFPMMGTGEVLDMSSMPSFEYPMMSMDELVGEHTMDPYAMHFNFEDLLDTSQL